REAFEILSAEVFPALVESLANGQELRIWSVACATGEEAYSLAICAFEALRAAGRETRGIRVFATDVHSASLDHAAAGTYPAAAVASMPQELRSRYFHAAGDDRVQVVSELRSAVVFGTHNVLRDAPFTKIDVLACRNLLIYFESDAQRRALSLLHFALAPGGVLMLGPSESPGELDDEFAPVSARWRIYRKRRDVRLIREMTGRLRTGFKTRRTRPATATAAERATAMLLATYAPPSLLISRDHTVSHTFAGGGEVLKQADGATSLRVLDLVDGDTRDAMWGALHRLAQNRELVVRAQIASTADDAPYGGKDRAGTADEPAIIEARSLGDSMLVSFLSERPPAAGRVERFDEAAAARISELEDELRATRRELHAAMERVEIANEELLASNEELRSTNEELQSVNEELQTVNTEYESKIDELTELTTDFEHLLAATDIYIGFLDAELCLRKFTPRFAEVFHLVEGDIGRRISGFAHSLRVDGLVDILTRVFETGAPYEAEIQRDNGTWLLLRVIAYTRGGQRVGLVVTLVDIERVKRAELRYKTLVESNDALVWAMDAQGQVVEVLPGIADYLGVEPEALFGEGGFDSVHPDEQRQIREQWRTALAS
ncbi:MAG: CheR family methyltransferase, partial [Myxococcota bacterium]